MQPVSFTFKGNTVACERQIPYAQWCAAVVDANKATLGLKTAIKEFDIPGVTGYVRVESMDYNTRVLIDTRVESGGRPGDREKEPEFIRIDSDLMWMPEGFYLTPKSKGSAPFGYGLPNTPNGIGTPGGPLKDVILNRYADNLYPDALIGSPHAFPIAYNDLWNAPYLYDEAGKILGKNDKFYLGSFDEEGTFQNQPYFDNRTLMNEDVKSKKGDWYCHRPYIINFVDNDSIDSGFKSTVMKTVFDLTNASRAGKLPLYGPLRGYYNQVSELTVDEMVTTSTLSHGYTKYRLGARTFDQRLRTCGGAFPLDGGENLVARSQVPLPNETLEDFRIRLGTGFMQWWSESPPHLENITRDWVDPAFPTGSICSLELAVGQGIVQRVPAASYLLDPVPYPNPVGAYYAAQTFVKRYNFVSHAPQQSRWQGDSGTVGWVGLPNPVAVYRQLGNREYSKLVDGSPRPGFVGMNHVFIKGRAFDVYRDNFNFSTGESRIICGAGMFSRKHPLSEPEQELRDKLVEANASAETLAKFDASFPDEQYLSVGVLVMESSRTVAPKIEILIMPVGEPNFLDYWLKPGVPERHNPLRPGDDIFSNRYTHHPIVACSVNLSVEACEHMRMEFSPNGLKAVIRIAELVYHPNSYFAEEMADAGRVYKVKAVAEKDRGAGTDLLFYEFVIDPGSLTATSSVVHRSHVEVTASGVITHEGLGLTYTQSVDTTYIVWANYNSDNALLFTVDKVDASLVKGNSGLTFSETSTLLFQNGSEFIHRQATWSQAPGPYVSPNGFNIQFEYLDPMNPDRRIYSKTSVRQLELGEGREPWMPIRHTESDETEFVDCKEVTSGDPPVTTLLTGPFFRNEVFIGDTKYVDQPYAMTAGGGITGFNGVSDLRLFSSLRHAPTILQQPYTTGGLYYEHASAHGCLLDKRTLDSRIYYQEDGSAETTASKTYKANDACTATHTARLDGGNYELVPIPRCHRYRSKTQSIAPMVGDGRAIADWCIYDGHYIAAYSLYATPSVQDMQRWSSDGITTRDEQLELYRPATQSTPQNPFGRGTIWGQVAFGLPRSDAVSNPELYPHVVVSSLDLKAITGVSDLDGNIFPFGVI
jgi:hypothetical protein